MSDKQFFSVEVTYYSQDNEIKLFRLTNLDAKTLYDFRTNAFSAGIYRKYDADTGEVISPYRIHSMMVYRQSHFFNADDAGKKLIHPKK
jgi:hypothetical protein